MNAGDHAPQMIQVAPAGGERVAAPPRLALWLRIALAAVIAAGLGLRVIWPGTTVFCNDQAMACALAEDIAAGRWQSAAVPSSAGFRSTPGYVYLLAAAWKTHPSPMTLLYFITAANVAAVALAFFLMRRWLGAAAAWWATALLASTPWAIHYSRWIWNQDLLFPTALLAYWFLWRWLQGRRWAALGLVLAVALVTQIHLSGLALGIAVLLYWLWARPKVPFWPVAIGVVIAVVSFLPYLLGGHLGVPSEGRMGYRHFWRTFAGAAMSVTGLHWGLEFKDGYPAFVEGLQWRHWAYQVVLSLPLALLAGGVGMGLVRLWRQRRAGLEARRSPLSMIAALAILVLVAFVLTGFRTSPTYLPLWYPLPFALMGWAAVSLMRRPDGVSSWRGRPALASRGHPALADPHVPNGEAAAARSGPVAPPSRPGAWRNWLAAVLLAVMAGQLAFFAEQLNYMRVRGGVPGSVIERSYAGATADVTAAVGQVHTREVYLDYEGRSNIQDAAAAWLFRHAKWSGDQPGRTLIRFAWGQGQSAPAVTATLLPDDVPPDANYFQVRPWTGPQERGGGILYRPAP